ncbi:hypothetical protein [Clostridium sp. UBA6640]|uniref:hypothetical protein n=1 Tax=Clostridium sp. UBA6640 TaxID=1946370 RepID=UPI0025BA1520|nr:hypothetical protein [Clostridium sp. UBA6640]
MKKEDKNKNDNNDKKNKKNKKDALIYIIGTQILTSINNVGVFIQYGITEKLFFIILLYWVEKHKFDCNIDEVNEELTIQGKKPSIYFASATYIPTPSLESYIVALPITEEEFIFFLGIALAFNQIVEEPEQVVEPERI